MLENISVAWFLSPYFPIPRLVFFSGVPEVYRKVVRHVKIEWRQGRVFRLTANQLTIS